MSDLASTLTDEVLLQELGGRLARQRLQRDWTQVELAHEAGVSKRTVERLEAGHSVQLSSWLRVLRALGLVGRLAQLLPGEQPSPMELLRGKGKPRKRASPARVADGTPPDWHWGDES